MKTRNYAKINLTLDILGVLENGYHDLEMVMQLIDLYDEVEVGWKEGGDSLVIKITSNRDDIPLDENNIAYKAAELMAGDRKGIIDIHIQKKIPVAAGLAGGSGNAACVISSLNELMDLRLSVTELMELGAKIGKDVPYIISGYPCAVATYDGTKLRQVQPLDSYLVLSKPDISVSTGAMYGKYDEMMPDYHPDTEALLAGITEKNMKKIGGNLGNVLEKVAVREYNCIKNTKDKMQGYDGVCGVSMSGSGPSVFALVDTEQRACEIAKSLKKVNKETFATRTIIR